MEEQNKHTPPTVEIEEPDTLDGLEIDLGETDDNETTHDEVTEIEKSSETVEPSMEIDWDESEWEKPYNGQGNIPRPIPDDLNTRLSDPNFIQGIKNKPESDEVVKWADAINEGRKLNTFNQAFVKSLEGGSWSKGVEVDGEYLSVSDRALNASSNVILKGQDARSRARVAMGAGKYKSIPLWASGIWIELDPIPESDLVALYREITSLKVDLGSYTYGAMYSATTGIISEIICKFIVKYIGSTSLKYDPQTESILDYISICSLQSFIGALNEVIMLDGYNFNRACTLNPSKCNEVITGKLDLSELRRTDFSKIPTECRSFMANSRKLRGKVTNDNLIAYKNKVRTPNSKTVTVTTRNGTKFKIKLAVPSLGTYFKSTNRWVNDVKLMVEDAVVKPTDDEERNNFITQTSKSNILRKYSHFITEIEWGDNVTVVDIDGINGILDDLSPDMEVKDMITEAYEELVNDTIVTIMGITAYSCPKCKKEIAPDLKVLPIDQLELFTHLLGTIINMIDQRR